MRASKCHQIWPQLITYLLRNWWISAKLLAQRQASRLFACQFESRNDQDLFDKVQPNSQLYDKISKRIDYWDKLHHRLVSVEISGKFRFLSEFLEKKTRPVDSNRLYKLSGLFPYHLQPTSSGLSSYWTSTRESWRFACHRPRNCHEDSRLHLVYSAKYDLSLVEIFIKKNIQFVKTSYIILSRTSRMQIIRIPVQPTLHRQIRLQLLGYHVMPQVLVKLLVFGDHVEGHSIDRLCIFLMHKLGRRRRQRLFGDDILQYGESGDKNLHFLLD